MLSFISVGREDNNKKSFLIFSHVYQHFIKNLRKLNYEKGDTEVDQNVAELLGSDHSTTDELDEEEENMFHGKY